MRYRRRGRAGRRKVYGRRRSIRRGSRRTRVRKRMRTPAPGRIGYRL